MMTLKRIAMNPDGVFGVLLHNGAPFALTCERPWMANASNVSCIPEGIYRCKRVNSPRFGDTFEVTNVPGRSNILFHKGNTMDDSQGCILVGEQFETLHGKTAVLQSGKGYGEFMERLKGMDEFQIQIKWG